jgi:hypothetical protein
MPDQPACAHGNVRNRRAAGVAEERFRACTAGKVPSAESAILTVVQACDVTTASIGAGTDRVRARSGDDVSGVLRGRRRARFSPCNRIDDEPEKEWDAVPPRLIFFLRVLRVKIPRRLLARNSPRDDRSAPDGIQIATAGRPHARLAFGRRGIVRVVIHPPSAGHPRRDPVRTRPARAFHIGQNKRPATGSEPCFLVRPHRISA